MTRRLLTIFLAALGAVHVACNDAVQAPPHTLAEFQARPNERLGYPPPVVMAHNLQRAFNRDLGIPDRVKSLELAVHLGGSDPAVLAQVAELLADPDTPAPLREAALDNLLRKDYANLAGYVVKVLPHLGGNVRLREAALDWLGRHPQPEALSEVVRIWAEEPNPNSADEPRYRQVVQRMSGQEWEPLLLGELNNPAFTAYAAAFEILSRRVAGERLRTHILGTVGRSDAVRTLQSMIGYFGTLPGGGTELATATVVLKSQADLVQETSRVAQRWRNESGYAFNIRDFHLLSRLGGDPLRTPLGRAQLTSGISQALLRREHVPYRPAGKPEETSFDKLAPQLTVADLWNLHLLNELLVKPHVQAGMRVMAERDRADRGRAWGGLIYYRNGHAEPQLYEASKALGENDYRYAPTLDVLRLGRDALCLFHAHFEQVQNLARVGPDASELTDARANNMYGLVVTSISEAAFAAHYYTPRGQVVSLGVFPFGTPVRPPGDGAASARPPGGP